MIKVLRMPHQLSWSCHFLLSHSVSLFLHDSGERTTKQIINHAKRIKNISSHKHSNARFVFCFFLFFLKKEILVIVSNCGPTPLTFNQSGASQWLVEDEWRRKELPDGAFWRAERRTERHISPKRPSNFHHSQQRGHSPLKEACLRRQGHAGLWEDGWTAMETLLAMPFGTVWPRCEFFPPWKHPVKFFFPSFLRHSDGNGASTQRTEPSSKTGPSWAHQLRHRPDPGSRYRAGKRTHGWKTKWFRFKQRSRGRLL